MRQWEASGALECMTLDGENIGVVAILTVVLNYSILFPSFTFFLDGFHLAFGDKFEICIKTTDLM